MISSNHVTAISSWKEVLPYAISSVIKLTFADDTSNSNHEETVVQQYSNVELKPRDDESNKMPVTVDLKCEKNLQIKSMEVVSNARHMEVYDNRGEYLTTVRGVKEDSGQIDGVVYQKKLTLDSPVSSCSLKFLSLADKSCLKLLNLGMTVKNTERVETYLPKKQIDMVKVRKLLSSMSSPVPENVEHLMETVEQYQENQSSVWNDIQQQAADTKAGSTSVSPMVGMLSMLARTSEMSQLNQGRTDSNTMTDAMSKMMASISGHHDNSNDGNELYTTLQGICKNVSQMRLDERTVPRRDKNEKIQDEAEKEASGIEKEPAFGPRSTEIFQQNIAAQLEALEERMMGRLERRLDLLEEHLELRLNRIEAVVEKIAINNRGVVDKSVPIETQSVAIETNIITSNNERDNLIYNNPGSGNQCNSDLDKYS